MPQSKVGMPTIYGLFCARSLTYDAVRGHCCSLRGNARCLCCNKNERVLQRAMHSAPGYAH